MSYKIISLNGHNELNGFATKRGAIEWVDKMLSAVKGFSLFAALIKIQAVCKVLGSVDKNGDVQVIECFPDTYDMPLLLINLVLKEHGIRIDE